MILRDHYCQVYKDKHKQQFYKHCANTRTAFKHTLFLYVFGAPFSTFGTAAKFFYSITINYFFHNLAYFAKFFL
jgi:hypothetical protein